MSDWGRYQFKGRSKVWVQLDPEGLPLDEKGKVRIAYKRGDGRTYTVHPENLVPIDGGEVIPAADWDAAGAADKEAARQRAEERAAVKEKKTKETRKAAPGARRRRKKPIVVYTDGACSGNPGPSGAGALLMYKGREKELSRYLGEGTNNTAELEAIALALEAIRDRSLPVDLHTDSSYAIGVLSLGWTPKAHRARILEIQKLMKTFDDLRLVKVEGHAGIEGNERVDELARRAIEEAKEPF